MNKNKIKWHDYIICVIVADVFSGAIFAFNPIILTLAIIYWASYEHLRKNNIL